MARGICKNKMGWGSQDSALVEDAGTTSEMSQERYVAEGYQPAFDELPWCSPENRPTNTDDPSAQ